MTIEIVPIERRHIAGFHQVLDAVAREGRYLGFVEAPPLDRVRRFFVNGFANGTVHYVGLDSLKFSMNAADEEQYEKIRQVKGRLLWDAVEHLREARRIRDEMKSKCGIYASSIQYDGDQAERMRAFLDEHVRPYVDEHYFLPLYGEMTRWSEQREKDLGFKPTAGNQGTIRALRDPLPCWSLWEGHVRADGKLTACCFDSDGRFTMGDLRKQPFMAAWHSPEFQDLRRAHLRKDVAGTVCEGCLAY